MFPRLSKRAIPAVTFVAGTPLRVLKKCPPHLLVLLGIVVAASFLRLWNLGSIGFRGDEAVYAGQAAVLAGDEDMERYFILISRGNSNFLLYQHVLSFFYLLFGVNDIVARAVSAAFSILTILIVFELGRTLYDARVGLIAALLLAISSYAVALGRLALLDSMLAFLFTLTMLCMAKWIQGRNPRWLYAFAAVSALAIQAKVVGGFVLAIFVLYLLMTRRYRSLSAGHVLVSSMIFLLVMTPAVVQVASNWGRFTQFLSEGGRRVSDVPWHYYVSIATSYEGYLLPLLWAAGVLYAMVKKEAGDLLCVLWIFTIVLFLEWHPLKAFNYLLPIVPALSVLAARAISSLSFLWAGGRPRSTGVVLALLVCVSVLPLNGVLRDDAYAGLREAGHWLKANTSADAGVMTVSRGSAQYAISFYAKRDSYPFGRFQLSTVLPGGAVLNPRPATRGSPTDWVELWPPRLIRDGTVSYLVYYTNAGDDPPDEPIVLTQTQRQFRQLIEDYGGRLVHTEYYKHEPRVWIYEVSKLLPKPQIVFSADPDQMRVEGDGFLVNSSVTIYYHGEPVAEQPTNQRGSFSAALPPPKRIEPSYFLTVEDEAGNYASSTGEHIWGDVDE